MILIALWVGLIIGVTAGAAGAVIIYRRRLSEALRENARLKELERLRHYADSRS